MVWPHGDPDGGPLSRTVFRVKTGQSPGQREGLSEGDMCESKVYLATAGGQELILEDVTMIRPEGDSYRLVTLFGEERLVAGRLVEIDLLKHRVVLESNP